MELIRYSDLPPIMKESPLFEDINDEDEIEIDKKYIFKEYNIKTFEDLILYLEIIRFLMIEKLPYEIYNFILENKELFTQFNIQILIDTFPEFENNFIKEFIIILGNVNDICNELIINESINALSWALSINMTHSNDICIVAAENDCLEVLKFLLSQGYVLPEYIENNTDDPYDDEEYYLIPISRKLAEYGCLKCLKYIHKELKFSWDEGTIDSAAENDNFECLKYLCENKCPFNSCALINSCIYGSLRCLKYLYELGCPYEDWVMTMACVNNNVNCLIYLINQGRIVSKNTFNYILFNGSIECLIYILSNINYPLEESYYKIAITHHQINCIKILHKYNCPWNIECYKIAINYGNQTIIEYFQTNSFIIE